MTELSREARAVPESKDAPCNICGRGWPYHHDSCAYKQTAIERDALAAALEERDAALAEITEVENTRVYCVHHGGERGDKDDPTCWCATVLDAGEKAKAIAAAVLGREKP